MLRLTVGLLAVAGLVGAGIVSAHGGDFGFGAGAFAHAVGADGQVRCDDNMTVGACRALLGDPCNDAMTVKDCRAALEAKHAQLEQERIAQCKAETNNATWCDHPFPMGGPMGRPGPGGPGWGPDGRGPHGGRGPRGPPPGNETDDPDA
jgi:hypothetical protein